MRRVSASLLLGRRTAARARAFILERATAPSGSGCGHFSFVPSLFFFGGSITLSMSPYSFAEAALR